MKKKIILISGDPNSINSEIIYKSWKKIPKKNKQNIYVITNYNLLKDQFKRLKYKIDLKLERNISSSKVSKKLKVLNIDLKYKNPFNVPRNASSTFVMKSLNLAHKLALQKNVAGVLNCPINKNLLKKNIGVTEFLASKCSVKNNSEVMMIGNKKLMVSPLTTHIKLKFVSSRIKKSLIINKIKTIEKWFKKFFKRKPKIGVLGLNPHNDEYRNYSEEKKIIIPAIKKLKKGGIKLFGPIPADTIFIEDYKKYDVIVGMYHDQVLAPFKSLYKFDAINITLGLKYIRISPDHGVAYDKILKKIANPASLLKCFQFFFNLNK